MKLLTRNLRVGDAIVLFKKLEEWDITGNKALLDVGKIYTIEHVDSYMVVVKAKGKHVELYDHNLENFECIYSELDLQYNFNDDIPVGTQVVITDVHKIEGALEEGFNEYCSYEVVKEVYQGVIISDGLNELFVSYDELGNLNRLGVQNKLEMFNVVGELENINRENEINRMLELRQFDKLKEFIIT